MKSYSRVLITKWILKSSIYFCLPKKRKSALGLPILARQYGGSKVIFWIQLESYRKDFSKSRDIRETMFPSLNIYLKKHGKCLVLTIFRGNIGDIRLTSWCKFFTVRGGAKRPSNVEITCHQNLSGIPTFFPTNVKKKVRFLNLFQEILGNLCDRTGVEVIKTPSNNWNFFIPISWLGP